VVSFVVEGIEELVDGLEARGTHFEALPVAASFADQKGVGHGEITDFGPVKSAWLNDTKVTCWR
jgi:hypothetical protein